MGQSLPASSGCANAIPTWSRSCRRASWRAWKPKRRGWRHNCGCCRPLRKRLARPRWRDWLIWSVAELIYFGAIWAHLDGSLASGSGGQGLYLASVLVRIAAQLWLAGMVIRDIVRPEFDPVRNPQWNSRHAQVEPMLDDPDGGVLDGAPDASWMRLVPWLR